MLLELLTWDLAGAEDTRVSHALLQGRCAVLLEGMSLRLSVLLASTLLALSVAEPGATPALSDSKPLF